MSEVSKRHSELRADIAAVMKPDTRHLGDCPDRAGVCYCKQNRAHDALDSLFEQLEALRGALETISDAPARKDNFDEILVAKRALTKAFYPAGSPHSIDSQLTEEDFEIIAEDSSPAKEPHS